MHPLLAKLTGKPAIENWKDHLAGVETFIAALNDRLRELGDYDLLFEKAKARFLADPSKKNLEDALDAGSKRAVAAELVQTLRYQIQDERNRRTKAGSSKLLAAIDEAEAELVIREEAIRADDGRRSAELGLELTSSAAFKEIQTKHRMLQSARSWLRSNFNQAMSDYRTACGIID